VPIDTLPSSPSSPGRTAPVSSPSAKPPKVRLPYVARSISRSVLSLCSVVDPIQDAYILIILPLRSRAPPDACKQAAPRILRRALVMAGRPSWSVRCSSLVSMEIRPVCLLLLLLLPGASAGEPTSKETPDGSQKWGYVVPRHGE
jgi:hypothetical protein